MNCFKPERIASLRRKPLEQVWRDHMLAGSMRLASTEGETGLYLFLYPQDNEACHAAVQLYRECLADSTTFDAVSLEHVIDAIDAETDAPWIREVRQRYLGWEKIGRLPCSTSRRQRDDSAER